VLEQPQWLQPAAAAARVPPSDLTVTAGVVASTSLLDVTMEAKSPEAAEAALGALITAATPTVQRVSGPFTLNLVQPATGTAKPVGVSATQLLIVIFAGGLLIGSGAALLFARARRRPALPTPGYHGQRFPMNDPMNERYPSAG